MPSILDLIRLDIARRIAPKGFIDLIGSGSAHGLLSGVLRGAAPPHRGTRELLAAYRQMPWLRAVTSRVATSVASTTWTLYVSQGRDGRAVRNVKLQRADAFTRRRMLAQAKQVGELREIEAHPLLDLIDNANPVMTGRTARQISQAYLDLKGEVFWVLERNGAGAPAEIWPVPPHWVTDTPSATRPMYCVSFRGWRGEIPESEMVWLRDPDLENPYGRGAGIAEALGDELETDEYAVKHIKTWFYNRAVPELLIGVEQGSEEELKRAKQRWEDEHRGFFRAYRSHWHRGKLDVVQLGQSFQNMQLVELRRFERDTIVNVFGVPPEILGIVENSNRACHSDDTECLTADGWKRHDELTPNDRIATWNPKAERLEYQQPRQIVRYPYQGPMHHWTTKNVDVLVTPDHRMWTKTQFDGPFEIRRSYDLFGKKLQQVWRATGGGFSGLKSMVTIPAVPYAGSGLRGHEPDGDAYKIDAITFARFLGYFVSEGCFADSRAAEKRTHNSFAIRICQMPGPKSEEIEQALRDLNMGEVRRTVRRSDGLIAWNISNKSLWYWLKEQVGVGARNKRLPREVFEWNVDAQTALLKALMLGDGSSRRSRTKSTAEFAERFYSTASVGLADDVQQLCVQLGLRASIRRSTYTTILPSGRPQNADMYIVTISSKQVTYVNSSKIGQGTRAKASPVSEVAYNGIVWCVEVPNHLFFTRRNGKVALHGNTIDASDYLFSRWVLVPRLEFLRAEMQERLVPMFDERLILDYESPVPEDREYNLNVARAAPYAVTVDEFRTMMDLEELPDGKGKVFMVPFSLVPMSSFGGGEGPKPEPTSQPSAPASDGGSEAGEGDKVEDGTSDEDDTGDEGKGATRPGRKDDLPDRLVQDAVEAVSAEHLLFEANPIYKRVLEELGQRFLDDLGLEMRFDLLNPRVIEFLEHKCGLKIKGINTTTRDALRTSLAEGVRAGESIPALAKRVSEVFSQAKGWRATTIARTEVVGGSNFANWEAMRQSGVIEEKEWIATRDDRVRDEHLEMDGQIQPINEPFEAPGGETAMYPGDFGLPELDINCRCTVSSAIDGKTYLDTEEKRLAYWRKYDRTIRPYERQFESAMKRAFQKQQNAVMEVLKEYREGEE